MANQYQIKSTAGDKTITIQPLSINGQIESVAHSDISLIGQGSTQWGKDFNESVYHMVEHFACPEKVGSPGPGTPQDENDISPIGTGLGINNPINGQLWFNTTTNKLLVYNTAGSPPVNAFQTVNGITSGTVTPAAPFIGDLWYDTSVPQLKIYTGSLFISIADRYLLLDGSRAMEGTLFIGDGTVDADGRSLIITEKFGGGDPNIKFRNTALVFTTSIVDDILANDLVITKVGLGSPANSTTLTLHTGGNVSLEGGNNIPTLDAHLIRRDYAHTNFVDVAGDTMSGNLTFGDTTKLLLDIGSAATPSLAFVGSTDTGIFTPTAGSPPVSTDAINFATVGIKRLSIEADGTLNVGGTANYEILVTTDDDIPNKKWVDDEIAGVAGVPTGTVQMFSGASAPTGYLICDGTAVSRAGFPDLFALLNADGLKYGNGDGSTTFNVPDFRGRMPGGVGSTLIGETTNGVGTVSLAQKLGQWYSRLTSVNQMPSHNHGGGSHRHTYTEAYDSGFTTGANDANSKFTSFRTSNTSTVSNISSQGSSSNISTYPPILGVNFIIKT